jgi:hypothetical protein
MDWSEAHAALVRRETELRAGARIGAHLDDRAVGGASRVDDLDDLGGQREAGGDCCGAWGRRWLGRPNELDADEVDERPGADHDRPQPVIECGRLRIPDPREVVTRGDRVEPDKERLNARSRGLPAGR